MAETRRYFPILRGSYCGFVTVKSDAETLPKSAARSEAWHRGPEPGDPARLRESEAI